MNRGLAVPISFKLLTAVEEHTEENMKMANILGWCIELVSTQLSCLNEIRGLVQFIPGLGRFMLYHCNLLTPICLLADANVLLSC